MSTDLRIVEKFLTDHPTIALATIESWETEEIAALLDVLPDKQSKRILTDIVPFKAGGALERIRIELALNLVEHLPFRVAARLLLHVTPTTQERILTGLPKEISQHLARLVKHAKDTVGAHLEPGVLTINEDQKIGGVLTTVRKNVNTLKSNLYVVNRDSKLLGIVELKDLLTANPEDTIKSILKTAPQTAFIGMNINQLLLKWDDSTIELPVVDADNVFIGVVPRSAISTDNKEKKLTHSALATGNALGDLYLIGLTSLFGNTTQEDFK